MPSSNICTEPNLNKESYQKFINRKLDQDAVYWMPDSRRKWKDRDRSEAEVENNKTSAICDANEHQLGQISEKTRMIKIEGRCRGIPGSEESLQLNLIKKIPAYKRSKKDLQGQYEVIAPGSTILKDDDTTHTIKEPGKMPVTVRKSDMTELGTKAKKDSPLYLRHVITK